MEARTLTHAAIAANAAEERHQARAHAAGLRIVTPISAAVRAEMDEAAAVFADAVAQLAERERGRWARERRRHQRHTARQFAELEECPGCAEPVAACTCLHRICY